MTEKNLPLMSAKFTFASMNDMFELHVSHVMRKSRPYVNNKGADQPAHSRGLVSAFVIHCLDCFISLVSIFAIS